MWKYFITPCHCQVSYQTTSFKSTSLGLTTGWTFIPYQSKLIISTKISTHNSKPNILANSASAANLVGNQLHMCDPFLCKFSTQQVEFSTDFNYKHSHCYERWVGPNYLLPFQVPVAMFVLGYRFKSLRFTHLLGQAKYWLKIARLYLGTCRHLLMLPSFLLNEHIQQTIWSVQISPVFFFTFQ